MVLGYIVNEAQRSLNDVPNDFEAARDLCYTPVRQGWVYGQINERGLGSQMGMTPSAFEKTSLVLGILSTAAIVTLAAVNLYRTKKGY